MGSVHLDTERSSNARREKTHLATRNEGFGTFTISASEARRDQIGDSSALLNERIGFGTGEEFEGELSASRKRGASASLSEKMISLCEESKDNVKRRGPTFFISSIPIRMIAACTDARTCEHMKRKIIARAERSLPLRCFPIEVHR